MTINIVIFVKKKKKGYAFSQCQIRKVETKILSNSTFGQRLSKHMHLKKCISIHIVK